MRLCTDGEIADAGVVEFEIIHNAFNFIIPEKWDLDIYGRQINIGIKNSRISGCQNNNTFEVVQNDSIIN